MRRGQIERTKGPILFIENKTPLRTLNTKDMTRDTRLLLSHLPKPVIISYYQLLEFLRHQAAERTSKLPFVRLLPKVVLKIAGEKNSPKIGPAKRREATTTTFFSGAKGVYNKKEEQQQQQQTAVGLVWEAPVLNRHRRRL
jgi:hypothetical protein